MLSRLSVKQREVAVGGVKPRTTALNIVVVLAAGLGSFLFGYANNAISGTLAQTSFINAFLSGSDGNSLTGGIIGGFLTGCFFGCLIQAPISHKYGRRVASRVAAVILIVSGALLAGSVNMGMFITFRVVCGVGAGMLITNVPVYMSEVSPPHTRGLLGGAHASSIMVAYILTSFIALGLNFLETEYAWRLQFVFMTFFAICLLVSLFFIPESPRWLIEQDRHDEAWKVLDKLHQSTDDHGSRMAHAELIQIQAQVAAEKHLPTGYFYILSQPHLRKRAICSILVWMMGMSTGILVIANETPTIFGTLGFDQTLQFALSAVYNTVALIGCGINSYLMDKVGRVKLLVLGGYLCSITLTIEAVLQKYYVGTAYKPGLDACIALYFIFVFCYGCTLDCAAYVYIAEIWPSHLRSHGATFGLGSFFIFAIAYSSPAALAFANIGYKYYFVFVSVCLCTATAILLYTPETAGLTLEEIGERFGDTVEVQFDSIQVDEKSSYVETEVKTDANASHVEKSANV